MSIRNKNGVWYYEFMIQGKRYSGTCLDSKGKPTGNEREALSYEARMRTEVRKVRANKSVKALAENYRQELTGAKAIPLASAYQRSLEKPRKRMPGPERRVFKGNHWADFVAYMNDNSPEVDNLAAVGRHHAESYAASLRTYGRYEKCLSGLHRKGKPLSGATVTDYLTTITEVFTLLADDAGLISNPFAQIPKPSLNTETRQPFTEEELLMIRDNLDDFTRPLFTLAISTALREGDICTLKWNEIDFQNNVIRRERMRKTQVGVDIPIMPPLREYLETLRDERNPAGEFADYVLPLHAKMYLHNRSGVSYRVKMFLEERCKIATTSKPNGRTRAVSVKDLHSCRHTFCYYAGLYGIPMNIVQGIVGHLTPEMTKLYSNHASIEAKREKMKLLPNFLNLVEEPLETQMLFDCSCDPEVVALLKKIPRKYLNELKQLLKYLASADSKSIIELRRKLTE